MTGPVGNRQAHSSGRVTCENLSGSVCDSKAADSEVHTPKISTRINNATLRIWVTFKFSFQTRSIRLSLYCTSEACCRHTDGARHIAIRCCKPAVLLGLDFYYKGVCV